MNKSIHWSFCVMTFVIGIFVGSFGFFTNHNEVEPSVSNKDVPEVSEKNENFEEVYSDLNNILRTKAFGGLSNRSWEIGNYNKKIVNPFEEIVNNIDDGSTVLSALSFYENNADQKNVKSFDDFYPTDADKKKFLEKVGIKKEEQISKFLKLSDSDKLNKVFIFSGMNKVVEARKRTKK